MRLSIIILILCVIVVFTSAQFITFERFYGGIDHEVANSLFQTSDNGYLICGYTYSFGGSPDTSDIFLVKTDSLGDTLWTRSYGGSDFEEAYGMQPTADNGFIIVGHTRSFSVTPCTSDVYIIKVDENGDTLWTKTYGGAHFDIGHAIAQTFDQGYIIAGQTRSFITGTWDVYIIRTDSLGDTLWTRIYGDDYDQSGRSVQQTSDGGFIITGYTGVSGELWPDIFLMKLNSSGDTLWTKTYGGSLIDYGAKVIQITDQEYIVAGYTNWDVAWESDLYLFKTDSIGDMLWSCTYAGYGQDMGFSLYQSADNGYIISGFTGQTGFDTRDVYVIKTDDLGDTLWTKTYGGDYRDQGYAAVQTMDGGYALAGFSDHYGTDNWEFYLIKTDPDGNIGIEENRDNHSTRHFIDIQVFPNPFCDKTTISFNGNMGSLNIEVAIFDLSGRIVKKFDIGKPGVLSLINFSWDGTDREGQELPSGVYILQLKTNSHSSTKKLILNR